MPLLLLVWPACVDADDGPRARRLPDLRPGDTGVADTAADRDPERLPGDTSGAPPDPTDAIFDPLVVHDVALEMGAGDWADIHDNPWAETWHPATFRLGDERVEGVGVRAFGYGSEIAGKPSLKIAFDHYTAGQRFHGLEQLKLDNSSQDVGFLNERTGTAILRRFDVPAARTGWARVTVNGDAAGFFVLLEPIDDVFVARWFGHHDGVLYSPAAGHWGQGLNPLSDPLTWYDPQTSVKTDGAELVALTGVVAGGSDDALAALVDLDGFARQSVARSVMGSMDALSADGNNFYLYDDHGVWRVIAWDLDVDLGGYYLTTALTVPLASPWTTSPWSSNPVSGAPYTDPLLSRHLAMGLDPDAVAAALFADAMDWAEVDAEIVAAADLIADDVHADVLGYGAAFDQRRADLRMFVHQRMSALLGHDVAPCPADADAVPLRDMDPTGTVGWGSLLVDASNWGPGFSVDGTHHCTGAFAHAPSDVTITVPDGHARLTGAVGLQDWVQQCGDGARFRIVQDDVVLWTSDVVRNYDDAVDFGSVAVHAGPLHLQATPEADYSCDTAAWLDVAARP